MLLTGARADDAILAELSDADLVRLTALRDWRSDGAGYHRLQSTRPQTLAYALTDSPVGQLAWIVEKFKEWTDSDTAPEDAIDRDLMLTNVMIYWLTGTAGSSAQLYWEERHARSRPEPSTTPTGVAVFPRDIGRSVGWQSAARTSCTGASSSAAGISLRWSRRRLWSMTSA